MIGDVFLFTTIKVELESLDEGKFPKVSGVYVHAMFYNILRSVDSALSEELHNRDELKPYTLSCIIGEGKTNYSTYINKRKRYYYKASFLDDDVFRKFYKGIYEAFIKSNIQRIGKINFKIINFNIEKSTTIDEIIKRPIEINNKFRIEFLSATGFRAKGRNLLFPEVGQVFKSYIDKWNTFVSSYLDLDSNAIDTNILESISNHCYVTKYHLETEILDMGGYKIVGFRGNCDYQIDKDISPKTLEIINNLLHFMSYCGTGYKTTMGMGLTRLVQSL